MGLAGGSAATLAVNAPDGNVWNTFLSGDVMGTPADSSDDVYHVITVGPMVDDALKIVVDGVRISHGNADGLGTQGFGGGIYVIDMGLEVSDCFILGNTAITEGGGIYTTGNVPFRMKKTRIANNYAGGDGGGVYMGIGVEAILYNNTFRNNGAGNMGGGFWYTSTALGELWVVNCILYDNRAFMGGALSLDAVTPGGEGRFLINNTIAYNRVRGVGAVGAGIHVDAMLANNTVELHNSIVVHNPDTPGPSGIGTGTDNVATANPASFNVTHSVLGTSPLGPVNLGPTVLNVPPLFRNGPARDLLLKKQSPCLEAGDDNFLVTDARDWIDVDEDAPFVAETLDRDFRIMVLGLPSKREQRTATPVSTFGVDAAVPGVIVDMGAYEHLYLDDLQP